MLISESDEPDRPDRAARPDHPGRRLHDARHGYRAEGDVTVGDRLAVEHLFDGFNRRQHGLSDLAGPMTVFSLSPRFRAQAYRLVSKGRSRRGSTSHMRRATADCG
jgi:hypothetical protein